MAKTYAAFYLPPEEKEVKLPDQKNVDRTANSLSGTLKNLSEIKSLVDVKEMAKNIDLQSTTEFTQRYAVGALTKIINGEAVTNKTMLDSLFNTYAPALNAGLAQTGFNSLVEMRNAAQAGNGKINVANFVQGFSNGLSIIQSATESVDYSKYGEEIPIDVVNNIDYTYNNGAATQKIEEYDFSPEDYISDLEPTKLQIKANVKNENAELWSVNDFNNKLVDIMANKTPITVRIGKSIYENCIIITYAPKVISIYYFEFTADLLFNHKSNVNSYNTKQGRIMNMNRTRGDFGNFNYNIASSEVYKGIIS